LGVNVVIPPVLLYAFGALLVSLGGTRAYYLGWRKRPELDDDDEADVAEAASAGPEVSDEEVEAAIAGRDPAVEAKSSDAPDGDVEPVETVRPRKVARTGGDGHKRHLVMGLLYVAMGLFLLVTTWIGQHH
jgi:hypothetical protein